MTEELNRQDAKTAKVYEGYIVTGNDWTECWEARVAAMGEVLGPHEPSVYHAVVPFDLGGNADVICFRKHVEGAVYVTSELIGRDDQVSNCLENYELAICHRQDDRRGPELISRLARYTCETPIEPNETMDIGGAVPEGSTISAFLFLEYARFAVRGRPAGILLCLGITAGELNAYRAGDMERVKTALHDSEVFPFIDWYRKSVV